MIVITNPTAVTNEINIIHSFFENGLELLHVRKPDYSESEMKSFLTSIESCFRDQLVLHQYHNLAEEFGINRVHFSEKERNTFFRASNSERIKSTSTHSITEFNTLEKEFDYAFLSPVFPSISKPDYVSETNFLENLNQRKNFHTKLVALGGISEEKIQQTLDAGFDDVALLGTIWNSTNPLKKFKRCQQIVLSF